MGYRVVVDFDLCESNALCMEAAPEVFEVRDDDFLYVLDETPARRAAGQGRGGRPALPEGRPSPSSTSDRRGAAGDAVASSSSARRWPGCGRPRSCGTQGFDGTITVVGDEPHRPYDRPPAVQAGAGRHLGRSSAPRSRSRHRRRPGRASTSTGGSACGPPASTSPSRRGHPGRRRRAVRRPGHRHRRHAPRRCRAPSGWPASTRCARSTTASPCGPRSTPGPGRVVVVGAGFIGAEVAATCREPRARRHAGRGAAGAARSGPSATRWARVIADLHRDHGVDLRLGVGVAGFEGGDRVEQVRLADGTRRRRRRGRRRHRRRRPTPAGSRARA